MNRNPRLVTAPRTIIGYQGTIIGYQGCSRPLAETIRMEGRFLASTNAYDGLGEGIYFWGAP